jgi:DNA-binding NarL/FixJ family response regulator
MSRKAIKRLPIAAVRCPGLGRPVRMGKTALLAAIVEISLSNSRSTFVKGASKYLQQPRAILDSRPVTKSAATRTGTQPYRVVAVGDTIISEQGLVAIVGRDPRYYVCGAAHTFEEANKLVQQHRPDVLLIEPFLESRDAIRWIRELAREFPRIRILVVTRQSELTYAERALHAGASGYWMKNSSVKELMHAIETVLAGDIYASRAITSVVMRKFAGGRNLPPSLDILTNREMAVFGLIAAKHRVGEIAKALGISRKTVESHCKHIKEKLDYRDAEELRRGARELLGTAAGSPQTP